jgi:hypothetical protein
MTSVARRREQALARQAAEALVLHTRLARARSKELRARHYAALIARSLRGYVQRRLAVSESLCGWLLKRNRRADSVHFGSQWRRRYFWVASHALHYDSVRSRRDPCLRPFPLSALVSATAHEEELVVQFSPGALRLRAPDAPAAEHWRRSLLWLAHLSADGVVLRTAPALGGAGGAPQRSAPFSGRFGSPGAPGGATLLSALGSAAADEEERSRARGGPMEAIAVEAVQTCLASKRVAHAPTQAPPSPSAAPPAAHARKAALAPSYVDPRADRAPIATPFALAPEQAARKGAPQGAPPHAAPSHSSPLRPPSSCMPPSVSAASPPTAPPAPRPAALGLHSTATPPPAHAPPPQPSPPSRSPQPQPHATPRGPPWGLHASAAATAPTPARTRADRRPSGMPVRPAVPPTLANARTRPPSAPPSSLRAMPPHEGGAGVSRKVSTEPHTARPRLRPPPQIQRPSPPNGAPMRGDS